ncbi:MAG TPA: cyclic nucleotide-binding domain-containing protein [Pyrinomonadaceae bacterium]|nr:cyclic nucleotide-binding domain-containing protein [Pyrinomonadaceae bacterium]
MPHEITEHRALMRAIERVECLSELLERHKNHYKHELDLEVIVYGRGYTGGPVGPYARLWRYDAGETVTHKGDWAGNSFYILVEGELEVSDGSSTEDVESITAGQIFGEMAIIEGDQRSKTVRVPEDLKEVTIIELQRPALRLLRKLPKFESVFDGIYREHGLNNTLRFLRKRVYGSLAPAMIEKLACIAQFKVYGSRHPLVAEGEQIKDVLFINKGWVEIVRGLADGPAVIGLVKGADESAGVHFLGAGNCLGLEADPDTGAAAWPYSATAQARTEVLEIPLDELRADPELWRALRKSLSTVSDVDETALLTPVADLRSFTALQKEITTGVLDGTNLLVMDMDLCVRCGNCSLACHKVHGQSRLLRRGIHIERPVRVGSRLTKHVLSPSVCMHCEDPECLTGCPTGAISRTAAALIDISPTLCIGCGDCATQCPYNAISMIPREKNRRDDKPAPTLPARLRRWLSPLPPPLPASVPNDAKDLKAIKCNLCAGTGLNPEGAKGTAYSCEENCPTGALVRVNPREYFSEAENTIGIVYKDLTHAIGRNIHKRDTPARLLHIGGWCLLFALAFLIAASARRYELDARLGTGLWGMGWLTMRWLTGIIGLLGVGATMAYHFRKKVYTKRCGALRYWMWAHTYIGACAGLVLLWHGGSHAGGALTLALMTSFDLVVLSGLFGLGCYIIVPRIMTSIEGDPLLLEDLEQRHKELCAQLAMIDTKDPEVRELITGKVRRRFFTFSFLLRQYVRREKLTALQAGAREEFNREAKRRNLSDDARSTLLDAVEATVVLRRVQSLIYLHKLLSLWLVPHVIFTSLMLLLLVVHIIQVVFFAVR